MAKFKADFTMNAPFYQLSRPDYPTSFVSFLSKNFAISSSTKIADIGSGTGKSSLPFLKLGATVYGIEPNRAMREEAENYLIEWKAFKSMEGSAEQTNLENGFLDIICIGQALHWFDMDKARAEFRRISKPEGKIIIFWNHPNRKNHPATSDFFLLVDTFRVDSLHNKLNNFSAIQKLEVHIMENHQFLDFNNFLYRLLSISHLPCVSSSAYTHMIKTLEEVFNRYSVNGLIELTYNFFVYVGEISDFADKY